MHYKKRMRIELCVHAATVHVFQRTHAVNVLRHVLSHIFQAESNQMYVKVCRLCITLGNLP